MKTKFLARLIVALACTAQVVQADDEIKLGWIGPLTGNSAVLGVDGAEAVKIAVSEWNANGGIDGHRIQLFVEDDQYDTTKALTAYSTLVSQGAAAIFVATYGGVFAIDRRAIADGVIIMNPLDCNDEIAALSENIFCLATQSESIGAAIIGHIEKNRGAPVGIIFDERNPFMVLVAEVLNKHFGGSNLISLGVDQNTVTDFRSILLRNKSKRIKSLVLLGHDPMGQAMREARGIGLNSQFYTVGTITSPGYQKLAGAAANGTYVAYWEAAASPKLDSFLSKFKKNVGREPILQLATIPSYDSANILLASFEGGVPDTSQLRAAKIRERLLALHGYHGLSGNISMDRDGAVRSIKERIYKFSGGRLLPSE